MYIDWYLNNVPPLEDTKFQGAHYEGYHDTESFNTTSTTPTKNTKIF